ncbi:MAG: DUF115 domain-containing protein, partial [Proteobacteria bacterium]|nr:DUF115 domain-containing protein [Pseudomonadota bacterium]
MTDQILNRNLEALAAVDRSLVGWIQGAQDSPYLKPCRNDSGLANLRLESPSGTVTLYDPADSPDNLSHFSPEKFYGAGDTTILSGFGLGHEATAVLGRAEPDHQVWILEPDALITRHALSGHDFAAEIQTGRLQIIPPQELTITAFLDQHTRQLVYGQIQIHLRPQDQAVGPQYDRLQQHLFQTVNSILARPWLLSTTGPTTVENLIQNLGPLSRAPEFGALADQFSGRPAVVVASGPSLARALPHLARIRDRALILAAVQALKVLLAHDIRPDLAVALDHTETVMDLGRDLWAVEDVPLLVRPGVYPEFVRRYGGQVCMAPDERAFWLDRTEKPPLAPALNVASLGLAAARFLGSEPVILVGCDFALGPGSLPGQQARGLEGTEDEPIVEVMGQDGRPRPTLPAYLFGLSDLENIIAAQTGRVWNASVGGARIKGTTEKAPGALAPSLEPGDLDRSPLHVFCAPRPAARASIPAPAVRSMADRLRDLARRAEAQVQGLEAFVLAPDLSEALYAQAEDAVAKMFDAVQAEPLWLYLFHGDLDDLGGDDYRLSFEAPQNQAWRLRRAEVMKRFLENLAARANDAAARLESAGQDLARLEERAGAVRAGDASARAWGELAADLAGHGLLVQAGWCLSRAMASSPGDDVWRDLMADNLWQRRRFDLAKNLAAELTDEARQGLEERLAGEADEAAVRAERALADGDFVTAIVVARRALAASSDHGAANRVLKEARQMRDDNLEKSKAPPSGLEDRLAAAEGLFQDKQFEGALVEYGAALDLAATDAEAMPAARGILIALRALDRLDDLEKFCRRMGRLLPHEALFDCELGDVLMARDEMDEAVRVIARGIAKDERFSVFWAKLATAFM